MTLANVLTILSAILFGVVAGIREGMVNIKPIDPMHRPYPGDAYEVQISNFNLGLRGHVWHGHYHTIRVSVLALFSSFLLSIVYFQPSWFTIAGSLLLIWEFTEAGEAYGRQGRIIYQNTKGEPYEHIYLGDLWDKILTGPSVIVLHVSRILIAGALISLSSGA